MAEITSPTLLTRVRGVLDPAGLATQIFRGLQAPARVEDPKSSLLSHTEMVAPGLAKFGAVVLGEALTWSVKETWVNVLETGGRQSMHVHANSFVSGVLYLTPSHLSAGTVFLKGTSGTCTGRRATRAVSDRVRSETAPLVL